MKAQEIFEKLKAKFGEDIISINDEENYDPFITVKPDNLLNICLFLRDNSSLDFNYLTCLSGMDYKDSLGVVYHLYSTRHRHSLVVKLVLDRESPKVHTVERVWKSANWHEREAYDMFGIVFEGHPNMTRILCPDDWEGWPLRKDYTPPEYYAGMKVPY